MSIIQITVQDLAQRLSTDPQNLQLIDVRERDEVAIASIPNFEILPLSEYDQWGQDFATKFDPTRETMVLCHHGMRSMQMCEWLVRQGFSNVKNIRGGIDAYAHMIDPQMAKY
jgi:rhodanese-related sulfurtransferase